MKFKSITHKWVFNFIVIIASILIIISLMIFAIITQYFNNYLKEALSLNSIPLNDEINSIIAQNSNDISQNSNSMLLEIKYRIEHFLNYDNILAVGLNSDGKVIATSNKLSINGNYDIFKKLVEESHNKAIFKKINLNSEKEKIITYTVNIPIVSEEISAITYIASFENTKRIIKNIFSTILILVFLIIFFIIASGVFYIKYFVNPVREINFAIKEIAKGNLKHKIVKNYRYEIKQLRNSINFMVREINNSEYLKNEFISSVSHELRTPLTAIRGWSETILNSKKLNKDILNKGMEIISKEILRLSEMVENLLDFSKITTGHFILRKNKMDLFAELQEAVLIYSDIALKEGKNLIYSEQKKVPIIFGDKNRIRQIFINVIDNAVKYSEAGDTISITTEIKDDIVIVAIKDTGCGIAENDLDQITKKFFKSNLTRKGSGIGLSIVKEIIEKHDGRIYFKSKIEKGTTVFLEFKLYKN